MKNFLHFNTLLLLTSAGYLETSAQAPAEAHNFDGTDDYVSIPNLYYPFSKELLVE